MKKLLLAISLALSGCMYQSINSSDIEYAATLCKGKNSTVSEILAYWHGDEWVQCSNRERFSLK